MSESLQAQRDQILFPRIARLEFELDHLEIAARVLKKGEPVLLPHPRYAELKQFITQQMAGREDDLQKFVGANLIFIWDMLNGVNPLECRVAWLKKICVLRPDRMGFLAQDFQVFTRGFTALFLDLNELLDLYARQVLQDDFWSLNLYQKKSLMLWVTSVFWNIYGPRPDFLRIYPAFLKLFEESLGRQDLEMALFMHHPLATVWMVNAQTQDQFRRFLEDVSQKLSRHVLEKTVPSEGPLAVTRKLIPGQDLKIGFVMNRLVENSPLRVLRDLLRSLKNVATHENLKLLVYDAGQIEKSPSDQATIQSIRDLGIPCECIHGMIPDAHEGLYYSVAQKLKILRKKIVDDGVDVLIVSTEDYIDDYLLATRTAPVQIFWSHGNYVYDVPGIDARITHGGIEDGQIYKKLSYEGCDFLQFQQAFSSERYAPEVDPEVIRALRARFPRQALLLGSIGRSIKVESESYMDAVAQIMTECPDTVYVAVGAGNYGAFREGLMRRGISGDRVFLEGYQNPHPYGYILDLFLDTFPLQNGESLGELVAKQGVFVRIHPSALGLMHKKSTGPSETKAPDDFFRMYAYSQQDYIQVACYLIRSVLKNPDRRRQLVLETGEYSYVQRQIHDPERVAQSFVAIIREILSCQDHAKE